MTIVWRRAVAFVCAVALLTCGGVAITTGPATATGSGPAGVGMATLMQAYDPGSGIIGVNGWWGSAVALSTMETYQQATGDSSYDYAISTAWADNHTNNFETDALDDTLWWALAWTQAYDLTGDVAYLQTAEAAAAYVHGYWDSACGGGVWWSTARTYKNAITNELFLDIAATLHNRVAGDTTYLSWAQSEWAWFQGSGMINGSHLINDGLTSGCANNGQTTWTYNQGVILAGLGELHQATGDASLIGAAEAIADAATATLTVNGVLVESCEPSCGPDGPSFKGIFVRDLRQFATEAHTSRYDSFLHAQAASVAASDMNSSGQMGLSWAGPVGATDTSTQASAEAALVADLPFGTAPCDIYGLAGTPCVSADSTTRALYSSYTGQLYQVQRSSDGATADVGVLEAGGYANAAAQDSFCLSTNCVITKIYDQTPEHNDLTIEGPGGAGGQDVGANAAALPITAGGHKVYGVYIAGDTGYRRDNTNNVAVNGQPEGAYMVASGTHVNSGCCFDYGNVETNNQDNGAGHMDAVNLTTYCGFGPCTGPGPWVEVDLENGQYLGGNGNNTANASQGSNFVTALLKNDGQARYALKGGDATSGGLNTWWDGALPNQSGYAPMHQEGAIVLGTGGDNSNASVGSFFEGVMTAGFPSNATDSAVQADIVSAGYSGASNGESPSAGTITGPGGQCVDVAGDDSGVDLTPVQLWNCQSYAVDQHWTHNSDFSLSTLGRCLDIDHDGTSAGSLVELWDCNGVGGQKWVPQTNGSLLNPQSGMCLDAPSGNTANGTQLQIWSCNGTAAQKFTLNGSASGGGDTSAPSVPSGLTASGTTASSTTLSWSGSTDNVGVSGYDVLRNGVQVGTTASTSYSDTGLAASTTYSYTVKAYDAAGNTSAASNAVSVTTGSGGGGGGGGPIDSSKWYQVVNANSHKCIDAAGGGTSNGTAVQQWACATGNTDEQWQFQPTDSGFYKVVTRNAPALGWDVSGGAGSTGDGVPIQLWTYGNGTNQQWTPVAHADGSYSFTPRNNTNECLDVTNVSTSDGARIQQWTCTGGPAQAFTLNPAS